MNDCDDKGLSNTIGNGSLIYEEFYKVKGLMIDLS